MKKNIGLIILTILLLLNSNEGSALDYTNFGEESYFETHQYAEGYQVEMDRDTIWVGDAGNGLTILDISNGFSSPELVDRFATTKGRNSNGFAHAPLLIGNIMYLPNGFGFYILDVSFRVVKEKSYVDASHTISISVKGSTLFLSDGSSEALRVYDVSDLENPEKIQDISVGGFISRSVIHDNYLIVATGEGGVEIFNIGNPSTISSVTTIPTGDANELFLDYPRLFVSSTDVGIEIVDLTNIGAPEIIATVETEGATHGVTATNDTLFVGNHNSLEVFDISDLNDISRTQLYPRLGRVTNLQLHDEYITFLERGYGLVFFAEGFYSEPTTSTTSSSLIESTEESPTDETPLSSVFLISSTMITILLLLKKRTLK